MNTREKLAILNHHRTLNNLPPLKAWKESTAKLDAKIAEYVEADPALTPQPEEPLASPVLQEAFDSVVITGDTITLADIARELKIDPKIARAKMRRITVPAEYKISAYEYHSKNKSDIIALLKKDFRRKV